MLDNAGLRQSKVGNQINQGSSRNQQPEAKEMGLINSVRVYISKSYRSNARLLRYLFFFACWAAFTLYLFSSFGSRGSGTDITMGAKPVVDEVDNAADDVVIIASPTASASHSPSHLVLASSSPSFKPPRAPSPSIKEQKQQPSQSPSKAASPSPTAIVNKETNVQHGEQQNQPSQPDNNDNNDNNDDTNTKGDIVGNIVGDIDDAEKVTTVGYPEFGSEQSLENLRSLYVDGSSAAKKAVSKLKIPKNRESLRILVTGGAGFIGSHLVDRLMLMGHRVTVLDNFFTGSRENIVHWEGHPNFELKRRDVTDEFLIEVDRIYHLACPASPPHYQFNPVKTIKTSAIGTLNMLGLAKRVNARILLTSTSEVYGDPLEHPQAETYWGNVNPIGPRACYDEGKRVAETLMYAYQKQEKVDVRVARIFNTFGPRMNQADGRVVSNFILQALRGNPITIYGDGKQTRSFQYVHDLVDGLINLMESDYTGPVNLGNPDEYEIIQFAKLIQEEIDPATPITLLDSTTDDPQRRKPDIRLAEKEIGWQPRFTVPQGIRETIEYFRNQLKLENQEEL